MMSREKKSYNGNIILNRDFFFKVIPEELNRNVQNFANFIENLKSSTFEKKNICINYH